MDFDAVVRTTFAAREFTDETVSDASIAGLLEQARFAPSGGNRQGWRVIVVRAEETRTALAELMTPVARRYVAQRLAGENPYSSVSPSRVTEADVRAVDVPPGLLDWVDTAPVILVICVDLDVVATFDADLDRVGLIGGASVYPFAWNILLAARNQGLGGTLTTFLAGAEPAAQRLLGIPGQFAVAGAIPLGHPVRQLTHLRRKPVSEFAFLERFGGTALGDPFE